MPEEKRLPDQASVARACGDGHDDGVVTAGAFAMRRNEIPLRKISVDWVECPYDSEHNRNEDGSVARLKARGVTRSQPVAFLPVADIHAIRRRDIAVSVIQDGHGQGAGRCHSAISGFTNSLIVFEIQQVLADIANRRPLKWIR